MDWFIWPAVVVGFILQLFIINTASLIDMPTCRTCGNSCSFGSGFEHCRCDADCVLYGDCCANRSTSCPTSVGFTELEERNYDYECRVLTSRSGDSRYIWMVSTCPERLTNEDPLTPNEDLLVQNCISDDSNLPLPVTDRKTGVVFKNEHCAACNRVTNYTSWDYDFTCDPVFRQVIANNSGVITLDALSQYCSIETFLPPTDLSVPGVRYCFPVQNTCPINELPGLDLEGTTGLAYPAIVELCANGPQNLVGVGIFLPPPAFNNLYCALCAGVLANDERVNCFVPFQRPQSIVEDNGQGFPFSIILDINGGGLIEFSTEVVSVSVSCADGQVFDFTTNQCRDTICSNGIAMLTGRSCSSECNGSLIELNETDFQYIANSSVLFQNQVLEVEFNTRRGFPVVCSNNGTIAGLMCILIELINETDLFEYVGNGSVLFADQLFEIQFFTNRGFPVVCFQEDDCVLIELNETDLFQYVGEDTVLFADQVLEVEFNTSRGFPVVCVNFTRNGTVNMTITIFRYPEAYFVLTYIGCSLSVIACVLLLVTYGLFKELRTLPSRIVMNLAVAIIIGNLLILLGGPITAAFPTIELCASVAILLQYFFLSQFSWMSIMSFEMARTFYEAFKLRQSETKRVKRNLLVSYLLIGWGAPLIITVVTIIVNYTTDGLVLYGVQEDGTLGSCWINHLESSVVAFIVPLALSLLFNSVAFTVTLVFICTAARSQAKLHKDKNIPYIRLTLAVFSVSGLTWLFGLLAIFSSAAWTWYPFIVFNTLQGLFIFVVFLTTKRVLKLYLGLFGVKQKASVDVKKLNDTKQSVVNIELEKASFQTEYRSGDPPHG